VRSKKRTQIAVLRHTLGSYEGQEEVFAATVQRSVSWVKKASSGLRTITPKTARQVSLATGVSEKWLLVGDPNAPILERDDVTPYTRESYEGWRRDNLTASYSDQSESSWQEGATTTATVDPRLVAAFASEITKSLFAAYEAGRVSTAINDLWKFSKVMKSRYGAPNELGVAVQFTRDVAVEVVELSNIEMRNMMSRNDR
jgi:hypothetical protein